MFEKEGFLSVLISLISMILFGIIAYWYWFGMRI